MCLGRTGQKGLQYEMPHTYTTHLHVFFVIQTKSKNTLSPDPKSQKLSLKEKKSQGHFFQVTNCCIGFASGRGAGMVILNSANIKAGDLIFIQFPYILTKPADGVGKKQIKR